jgi:hypothetical protein
LLSRLVLPTAILTSPVILSPSNPLASMSLPPALLAPTNHRCPWHVLSIQAMTQPLAQSLPSLFYLGGWRTEVWRR